MGLFDYVECEVPLPDGLEGELEFQTKDLECTLTTFKITSEGRLLRHEYEWEESEESPLGLKRVAKGWTDTHFHGFLNFYTSDENHNWHEYDAKFTDGELVRIVAKPSNFYTEERRKLEGTHGP